MSITTFRANPVLRSEYDLWLHRLGQLRARLEGEPGGSYRIAAEIEAALARPDIVVAFGGNQKAGKSTLVNGAMRRAILATDDLPETGVVCWIRAGDRDRAVVVQRTAEGPSERMIPCTPEALREVTALQPETTRKSGAQLAERVNLTLQGVPIPPGVSWLDAPGLDDTVVTTERARAAADAADVLVFVCSSRQFLSDAETNFLTAHIANHGPASVILVINVFLAHSTPGTWSAFHEHMMSSFGHRMNERGPGMGFTGAAPLRACAVDGRDLASGDGERFGGGELRGLMQEIRSPGHPRVRRTRLYRASRRLRELAEQIEARRAAIEASLKQAAREARDAVEAAGQRRERFRRALGGLVDELVNGVALKVRDAGCSTRASVSSAWSALSVSATCDYDRMLTEKSASAVDAALAVFARRLDDAIVQHHQAALPDPVRAEVRAALSPSQFNVTGGKNIASIGEGAEAAAALAGAGGSLIFGIFTFGIATAAVAAAAAAAAAAARQKAQRDAAVEARRAIEASIDAEAHQAATQIASERERIFALVDEACGRMVTPAPPDVHAIAELTQLLQLRDAAFLLADQARRLAGAEPP
jgi:hypothetical protein